MKRLTCAKCGLAPRLIPRCHSESVRETDEVTLMDAAKAQAVQQALMFRLSMKMFGSDRINNPLHHSYYYISHRLLSQNHGYMLTV